MKRLLLLISLMPVYLFSQKQGNIWYFGEHSGLDFSSGTAVVVSGGQTDIINGLPPEGTACISDSAGHLLFYSDGENIWNRHHQLMPNGTGLYGGVSSTQAGIIVPLPGSNELFYLFTTDDFFGYINGIGRGLRYTIVDMCADNGNGDVVAASKNILLMDSTSEKLAAVQDSQGSGFWILGRKMFTDQFYAWHLTVAGITDTVISYVDTSTFSTWTEAQGQMKISPDGRKIATVWGNYHPPVLNIFDMNTANGSVSNMLHFQPDSTQFVKYGFGVEFSPDGAKVYVGSSGGGGFDKIYQYDITAGGGTHAAVEASKYAIFSSGSSRTFINGMQLGPDGNIYVAANDYSSISVIEHPDSSGAGAVYHSSSIQLNNTTNHYGFTSFIAGYKYHNELSVCNTPTAVNEIPGARLYSHPNPVEGHLTVKLPGPVSGKVVLADITGKVICAQPSDGKEAITIDMSSLNAGIYILSYQSGDTYLSQKVIKE